MTEVVPFAYEGHQVRTITRDGEPWFVATDVCAALALRDTSSALKMVDSEDVQRFRRSDTPQFFGGIAPQVQEIAAVNESGVYALIFHSRKPEAKAFKRWVTHEVLPAIRRTGRYEVAPAAAPPLPDLSTTDGQLAVLDMLRDQVERRRALELENAALATERDEVTAYATELEPSAAAWESLSAPGGDFSVREAANVLNRDRRITTGQRKLFDLLREWKVIDRRNTPYATHRQHVTLRARTYGDWATGEQVPATPQVRITYDGLRYIHRRMLAELTAARGEEADLFTNVTALPAGRSKGGAAAKQYTCAGRVGFRVFDVAWVPWWVLGEELDAIARWRDHGGQHYADTATLAGLAKIYDLTLVPALELGPPPDGVAQTNTWLSGALHESAAILDGGAKGRPEGVVVRAANRSAIAKIRFEDYARTLKVIGRVTKPGGDS